MEYNDLKTLAVKVLNRDTTEFSHDQLEASLRVQLRALAPKNDYHAYKRNQNTIFQLISEASDLILPKRIITSLGAFAEFKQVGQGEKAIFTRKLGRARAKTFITRVAESGRYEAFRLDQTQFEVPAMAFGGAAYMELERYLDGHESLAELLSIFTEGYEDAIYGEVYKALLDTYTAANRPAVNNASIAGFDAGEMNSLLGVVRAYGTPTIFTGQQFASKMVPLAGFTAAVPAPVWGDADLTDMRDVGYIGKFAGASVVVLPNSFTDETNTEYVLDPSVAFIMPAGEEKIVKVVAEGNTLTRQFEGQDWSTEIQTYKKLGVAVMHVNHFGIYIDTELQ